MVAKADRELEEPVVEHLYQNWAFDALRWNFLELRPDDIIIATSYKAGTTWMQGIVSSLVFSGEPLPGPLGDMSPWLDFRIVPLELVLSGLAQQKNRRFIKTHLPLDGLPFHSHLKYIYVARDARDVFMSYWNHYRSLSDFSMTLINTTIGRSGPELPRCPDDIHEVWRAWITRGWFEWEAEGWPWWSNLHNVQSWWDYRHLPNILLIHYADLLADLEGEARRIAEFLAIDVPKAAWPKILGNCTLAAMRATAETSEPRYDAMWEGGAKTFFNKGTNGRWHDILSKDELALYDAAAKRELTPECRRWLETGGAIGSVENR